jgi:hypothetical protein
MSLGEYLHEKAEESRHNEVIGYLIVIIASIFLIGGILVTVVTTDYPSWFLFLPSHITFHPYSLLALASSLLGAVLLCLGLVLIIHYALERSWYIQEPRKAQMLEMEDAATKKASGFTCQITCLKH